jgi:hypothetical protein
MLTRGATRLREDDGGQWLDFAQPAYFRYGSEADIEVHPFHVRFTPETGHGSARS